MENWNEITEDILRQMYCDQMLSDSNIAERYGVTVGRVRYKRKKFGISAKSKLFEQQDLKENQVFLQFNNQSKERLLQPQNIDGIAKALTHYIFRNGPVEDMHMNGKLTEPDMKILNKYMVNRLAGILVAIYDEKWAQLELLYKSLESYGANWDKAEPDLKEMDELWLSEIRKIM